MKSKMKDKVIALAMSFAMALTMMPIMGAQVYADDPAPAAICLVNGIAPNIKSGQVSSIWFGNYEQSDDGSGGYNKEPIKWRVLDNIVDVNGNSMSQLLLLSDQNLDCKKYNDTDVSVTWKTSGIRSWLNDGFKNTAFSLGEQSAIKTTDVVNGNNPEYNTPGGENTQDQIFLLSIAEATNEKYGFTTDYFSTSTREAINTQYTTAHRAFTSNAGNGEWWLRSPGSQQDYAAYVTNVGGVNIEGFDVGRHDIAVRPAFKFDLLSAILTSAAEDGKDLGAVGADSLKEVGTNKTGEWKVTLKSGHDSFAVDSVTTCDGKTLNITYSGAVTGDKEYISAIIKDKDGKVKYYGNLKNCTKDSDASGMVKINVDGKLGADDTLCVFNEQLNGIKYTDFASGLIQLTIPEAGHNYRHEYVNDEYHKSTCITCGEETTERHTYSCGICVICNGRCRHSSLSDSYGNNSEWHWKECEYCSLKFGEEKHKWQEEWTADGTQHWHKCEVCQRKKDEEEHKWDEGKVTKDATCEENGVKTYTCTACKATKTEEIPATGHEYGEWTELDDKQHQRVCKHDATHIENENHSWDEGKVTKEATCEEKGVKTYTCTVCKATKTEEIPALGHEYGEWTELDADQHQRVCEHDATHIEKENHSWDEGKETKAATEQAEGVKTYTCTVCGETKTESTPKLEPSAVEYRNAEGNAQIWYKSSGKTADFTFKRSEKDSETFSHFIGIKVDGKDVAESDYTAESGSVIIKLKPEYLETLKNGDHKLDAEFDDGSASATFKVADKGSEGLVRDDGNISRSRSKGVDTGDKNDIAIWLIAIIASAVAWMGTAAYRKRRS